MKILLTGGGTGGHFYPLIAIAEEINDIVEKEHLLNAKLFYASTEPYDPQALFDNGIKFIEIPAGKVRRYFSLRNIADFVTTAFGLVIGLVKVFSIYPDIVVSKGGYASLPSVFAARLLRIPIIIHESDSSPGKLNLWASVFAKRIAVSFPEAASKFPKEKTAWVGQPVRKNIIHVSNQGAFEFFNLDPDTKTILILGGSQGAQIINDTILEALTDLLSKYQIIHQVGLKNFEDIKLRSDFILEKSEYKRRYVPVAFLNDLSTKFAAGASSLVISRAGSTIFEIAIWGKPSIIIPITNSNGDHQRKNAFSYARAGACEVIEESNLSPHVLSAEISKILDSEKISEKMSESAKAFATPMAAHKVAREAIDIALEHEG
jgi:UDP-N-acetylglucosamine--N-acetylmuramyl-(pentapeptide) pyrophosphoryl-undecaprenol N-acetylglucosamine transferase